MQMGAPLHCSGLYPDNAVRHASEPSRASVRRYSVKGHKHVSRRSFLRRTALAPLGAMAAHKLGLGTAHAEDLAPIPPHGAELRGMSLVLKNRLAEGRFGVMFKNLSPFVPVPDSATYENLLFSLGSAMEEQPKLANGATIAQNDAPNNSTRIPAGYTFLGQFIDHDITLDLTPITVAQQDPDATINYRSPRYDLDSIYGRGPLSEDRDRLYGYVDLDDPTKPADYDKLKIVRRTTTANLKYIDQAGQDAFADQTVVIYDVPRDPDGKAIIGDPRNDENLLVIQLHVAFIRFHNALVDYVRKQPGMQPEWVFEAARRLARWHYQWLVIHDFLPRIVGEATASAAYKERAGLAPTITINYYKPTNKNNNPFVPVEFSVAAYRFGHSMARPRYFTRDVYDSTGQVIGVVGNVPLFPADATPGSDNDMTGRRPIPPRLTIRWHILFPVDAPLNDPSGKGPKPSRKIDARLSSPLLNLPPQALPDGNSPVLLGVRNLLRGKKFGLPSGQSVARAMRTTVLSNAQLSRNAAGQVDEIGQIIMDPRWGGEAPLWFYILREAELLSQSSYLGPVGGRIVAEVLVGLLQRDQNSYLYLQPSWKPTLPSATPGNFTIVDLLKFAGATGPDIVLPAV